MRLIDADALIARITETEERCKAGSLAKYVMNAVKSEIEREPTVYDVEKVVSELEKQRSKPLTTDETQEIRTIMKHMHELFVEAWDLNNYGEGTDLSRMVTTYLPNIEQSYKYFVERSVICRNL